MNKPNKPEGSRWRNAHVAAASLMLTGSLLLSGCSMLSGVVTSLTPKSGPPDLRKIALRAEKQANQGAPVAVDLVFALESKPFTALAALRAGEWFNNKPDLLRQYQSRLVVMSWEIVPGQSIDPVDLPSTNGNLAGVLIFADYLGDQTYRADATGMREVQVHLAKDGFELTPSLSSLEPRSSAAAIIDPEIKTAYKFNSQNSPPGSGNSGKNETTAIQSHAPKKGNELLMNAATIGACAGDRLKRPPDPLLKPKTNPVESNDNKAECGEYADVVAPHQSLSSTGSVVNAAATVGQAQPRFIPRPIHGGQNLLKRESALHLRIAATLQMRNPD